MKYIIVRDQDGIEIPHFACAPVTHRELAAAWRRDDSRTVVAAGFVEIHDDQAFVFGRSESIELGPRPGDALLLTAFYRATVRMAREADARTPSALQLQPSTSTGAHAP